MIGAPYGKDVMSERFGGNDGITIPAHDRSTAGGQSEGDLGPLYKQQYRRFSAGDVLSVARPPSASSHTAFYTPSATFTQLSHKTSAPSSATFIMLLPGETIEDAIARIIETEEKRVKMLAGREERLRDLIAAHDRGESSLWETQYEWDVLVKCGDRFWRVHRDILCRESDWFKTRMPPKDPNGAYVVFNCDGHNTTQLTHALRYMYGNSTAKRLMTLKYALSGYPIFLAVYTYIAGASVGFERMMGDAQRALYEMALQLKMFFDATPAAALGTMDLSGLYDPLRRSLVMSFDQADAGVRLLGLRAALAHLCDVVLVWLVLDPGFGRALVADWIPSGVWQKVVVDNVFFWRNGLLDDMWKILVEAIPVRKKRGARVLDAREGEDKGTDGDPSSSR
ncbi:uncharacterized protein B0H64DRAFT_381918 [Chaetomium fimeti]|uniref:BTB domain-containing protein n=1 Tax=Chaetomium fimeti TaxID=1854472 RepID=A0AAE0HQC7_9PEZI|nr:hypothetical protein B0H64DRAFT_381918 [Chaetomium fimeti]